MMEGDLDELLRVLLFLEAIVLKRPGNRRRLAQHAVIHPGAGDVALVEVKLADEAPGFANRVLVGSMRRLGQLLGRLGRHRRDAKLVAPLQEHGVKEIAIVLLGPQTRAELVDGSLRPLAAESALEFIKEGWFHESESFVTAESGRLNHLTSPRPAELGLLQSTLCIPQKIKESFRK